MRIAATTSACVLTIASAYFLYAEGMSTRRLEAKVQASERQRERLESDISALKAERAWLARPARIEPAAKALGLRQPQPGELIELDALTRGGPVEPIARRH